MAESFAKTFEFLTTAGNVHAVDVLIYALDAADESIREKAGVALLRRAATRGQIEVIRRFDRLPPRARDMLLDQQAGRLTSALAHCLTHGNETLRSLGRALLLEGEYYELVPGLLQMIESNSAELSRLGGELLLALVNLLYAHSHSGKDSPKGPADQQPSKRSANKAAKSGRLVLSQLENALKNFDKLKNPDNVVEAALALGCIDHEAARKVLLHSPPLCRELAGRLLMTSRHPAVMQFVLDLLSRSFPPPRALQVVQERSDPEFVCHLLRFFPRNLNEVQYKNYHQIESIDWLDKGWAFLEQIPAGLHEALVSFVSATGVPQRDKSMLHQWIIQHGSSEGRLASAEALSITDEKAVKTALYQNLESQDESAQAWATGQLRAHGIPEAVQLLVSRLDSPIESVRSVAREELRSFNLDLMLNLFDQLDARICLRAGEILRKTDANCIQKLREEVSGPVARKRMQAARAAAALGMQHDVAAELVAMARDEDALIRRTAAEVLAEVGTPEAEEVLHEMLGDVNSRVRDEAEKSLAARLAGIAKESQNLSSAVHDSARNEPPVGAES